LRYSIALVEYGNRVIARGYPTYDVHNYSVPFRLPFIYGAQRVAVNDRLVSADAMRRTRFVPFLIALFAIAALGVAATTLDTTLTTDPDDEINPNWDRLPIGQSQAAEIQDQIGDDADDDADDEESDGDIGEELMENDPGDETEEAAGLGTGTGPGSADVSLFDRLMTILKVLLPLVVLLALGAFVYRYRERLLSVFGTEPDEEPTAERRVERDQWPAADPTNVVDRAWLRMVRRTKPTRPETATPAECTALAREQGSDVEAFEAIATAFERVQYGGVPLEEERPRAREGLRRLEEDE